MNKTFLLIFYNLKCSRKQIQPQKSLQRNCLWHLGWSKQPPKTPIPPAPHPTLPPEPFTLAVFPNFTDCIAELFIKTVCNKNSYTLQLYKFLQFSPSSWTEATSKGKPQGKKKKKKKKKKKGRVVKAKKQQPTMALTKPSLNPLSAPAVTLAFKSKGGCHRMRGQWMEEYKAGRKKGNQMNSELRQQGSHLFLFKIFFFFYFSNSLDGGIPQRRNKKGV